MSKATGIHFWYVLLGGMAAFMLVSCGVATLTNTSPPPSPTAVPEYIHYTPSAGLNIHLEFDYPGSWVFSEERQEGGLLMVVSLGDPRFRTLPTPSADDFPQRTTNDFGNINIWIVPNKPGQTSDTELELHKKSYSETSWITGLDDYKIIIDGYDASVIEYQINDAESYTSLMFARRIFFVVEDQMYEIYFTVAEKERGGEFEKGYEYFFNSLMIVP